MAVSELIEYSIPMIASSDLQNGAQQKTPNGSRFSVYYQRPVIIPKISKSVWITVENSTLIFNTPNVIDGVNDRIEIIHPGGTLDINIAQGLYDLDHLSAAIQQQLTNAGLLSDGVVLLPDTATQKVIIKFKIGYQVNFAVTNSINELLGFNQVLVPAIPATIDDQYETATDPAQFNAILYYLIHSDVVSGHGLRINQNYQDVLQQVPITVGPGSQISYEPQNLQRIPAPNLVGKEINQLNFWLTDDKNQDVNTLGEEWSVRFNIHYTVPVINRQMI